MLIADVLSAGAAVLDARDVDEPGALREELALAGEVMVEGVVQDLERVGTAGRVDRLDGGPLGAQGAFLKAQGFDKAGRHAPGGSASGLQQREVVRTLRRRGGPRRLSGQGPAPWRRWPRRSRRAAAASYSRVAFQTSKGWSALIERMSMPRLGRGLRILGRGAVRDLDPWRSLRISTEVIPRPGQRTKSAKSRLGETIWLSAKVIGVAIDVSLYLQFLRSDFSPTEGSARAAASGFARRWINISASRMFFATFEIGPTPLALTSRPSSPRWK